MDHEVSHFCYNHLIDQNKQVGACLDDLNPFGNDLDAFATNEATYPVQAYQNTYTYQAFLGTDPGKP